ncbi:hypothetical protein TNCV_2217791 [Trichonephila clavipes]|nr:hypothetical protein TNCV_2217791 [Trichonephila clavipes]
MCIHQHHTDPNYNTTTSKTVHSTRMDNYVNQMNKATDSQVSAVTIRRRLQQSGLYARRPLIGLPLTQNHRRLRRQWCDERRMWVV